MPRLPFPTVRCSQSEASATVETATVDTYIYVMYKQKWSFDDENSLVTRSRKSVSLANLEVCVRRIKSSVRPGRLSACFSPLHRWFVPSRSARPRRRRNRMSPHGTSVQFNPLRPRGVRPILLSVPLVLRVGVTYVTDCKNCSVKNNK